MLPVSVTACWSNPDPESVRSNSNAVAGRCKRRSYVSILFWRLLPIRKFGDKYLRISVNATIFQQKHCPAKTLCHSWWFWYRDLLFNGLQAKMNVHGDGNFPGQHLSGEPIDNCHQTNKSLGHWDVLPFRVEHAWIELASAWIALKSIFINFHEDVNICGYLLHRNAYVWF